MKNFELVDRNYGKPDGESIWGLEAKKSKERSQRSRDRNYMSWERKKKTLRSWGKFFCRRLTLKKEGGNRKGEN